MTVSILMIIIIGCYLTTARREPFRVLPHFEKNMNHAWPCVGKNFRGQQRPKSLTSPIHTYTGPKMKAVTFNAVEFGTHTDEETG